MWVCQSTTSCTKLHVPLNFCEASPCTLTHCIMGSTDCMSLHHPLYLHPPHMLPLVYLFVYFSFQIVSVIDRQWANTKSDCTCCIKRGLGRILRRSLILNCSPSTSRVTSLMQLMGIHSNLTPCLCSDLGR